MIELKEDDPIAVETLLRYIYNFTYPEIQKSLGRFSVDTHLSVMMTAKKYLLPKLETEAINGTKAAVTDIECNCMRQGSVTGVLEVIELLASYKDHSDKFEHVIAALTQTHLAKLFLLPKFRASMETHEGLQRLNFVSKAVACGTEVLGVAKWNQAGVHTVSMGQCESCKLSWLLSSRKANTCPGCGSNRPSKYTKTWV